MNAPESSVMSKSTSESGSTNAKMSATQNSKLASTLFPLFDNFSQHIRIPSIFYYIFIFWFLIQSILTSLWLHRARLWPDNDTSLSFAKIFYQIASFSVISFEKGENNKNELVLPSDSYLLGLFIGLSVVFLIAFFALFIQSKLYKAKRRYIKSSLYPTRIILELVPMVILHPLGGLIGQLFYRFSKPNCGIEFYIMFAIAILEYVYFIFSFGITFKLFGISPYLPSSPLAAFELDPFIYFGLASPTFFLASSLLVYFPFWIMHPVVLAHLILVIILLLKMNYHPFVSNKTNIIFQSILGFCCLLDILYFICETIPEKEEKMNNKNGLMIFILFLILLIISFVFRIIYWEVNKRIINKRIISVLKGEFKNLNNDNDDQNTDNGINNNSNSNTKGYGILTDEEKIDGFSQLGFFKSEDKAIFLMNYLIISQNPDLILIAFSRILLTYFTSNRCLNYTLRVLSFIPCNTRVLGLVFSIYIKKKNLSFAESFLLHQIQKIRLLRQSSASTIAHERMRDLKQQNKEIQSEVFNFFLLPSSNITMLKSLSVSVSKNLSLMKEAIADFPNSVPFSEEFCNFLMECNTNFTDAILQKHRIDLIESGKNFNVDNCFRQFVRNFPYLLKKNHIDLKGNFNRAKHGGGKGSTVSTSNNSNNSMGSSSNSFSSVDIQVEEGIGKVILSHARIRLALQRATNGRRANSFGPLVTICMIIFFIGFIGSIILYVVFNNYFSDRSSNMNRSKYLVQTRMHLYESALALIYHYGNASGLIRIDEILTELERKDDDNTVYNRSRTWIERSIDHDVDTRENLIKLLNDISEISRKGIDVYKFMEVMFTQSVSFVYCNGGNPVTSQKNTLVNVITYLMVAEEIQTTRTNLSAWYTNDQGFCNIISTLQTVYPSMESLRDTITSMASASKDTTLKSIDALKITIPVLYFCICFISFTTVNLLFSFELIKFIRIMLKMPESARKEASLPIRKDSDISQNDNENNGNNVIGPNGGATVEKSINIPLFFGILIPILLVIMTLVLYFMFQNIYDYNMKFQYLNLWTTDSRARKPYIVEITLWTVQSLLSYNEVVDNNNFIDKNYLMDIMNSDFLLLESAASALMQEGGGGYPSAAGVDQRIDDLMLKETCIKEENDSSYHEMYRCGSAQNLINFFMNTITDIQVNIKKYNGTIVEESPASILHIMGDHLIPKLQEIDDLFDQLIEVYETRYKNNHLIFLVVEMIIVIILFISCVYFTKEMNQCYDMAMILLRRYSPIAIVANNEIVNYLLEKSNSNKSSEMSTDQGILHNSKDAIISTGLTGTIDMINPAVSQIFGYSPEQLLGQSITTIIEEESKSDIANRLTLMINKQSSLTYEGHTICVSDDETKIDCSITILAMTNEVNIYSFVIILNDERELIIQQNAAENAKKQSESLLFQILPRDIVIRLNQGEKDISFSVPSSTISFIDIVKFSDYAANLTPQEIMGNLSLIFAGFDEAVTKYKMLLKIKLIGDVYMVAGGLFTPEEPPVTHAEQMIRFCLDSLQILEEVNVKLNAVLNVRIGVNTGGPLIAGVLGTDKPTFDIIGDPINIASRLQSTDVPGRIQISQSTYDLVFNLDFSIESRGEIFLKGKGKQQAYLISQNHLLAFASSAVDTKDDS